MHGSHYYYIFLYSKNNNASSHIFDKNSNFIGRYIFEEPVPSEERILHLDFKNKDITVLIDIADEDSWRNKAFHAELLEFERTPGSQR